MSETKKVKTVWAICTENSSCYITAVCLNREYAMDWVKKENKKYPFEMYFIERSQLLYEKGVR